MAHNIPNAKRPGKHIATHTHTHQAESKADLFNAFFNKGAKAA